MFSSVAEVVCGVRTYPELSGARVLVTGLVAGFGEELARELADRGARLVIQAGGAGPETEAALAALEGSGAPVAVHRMALETADDAVHFAQAALRHHGGLDAVVNLAALDARGLGPDAGLAKLETRVSGALAAACLITRVAANRMSTTWIEGSIVNVLAAPAEAECGRAVASGLSQMGRSALAAMTRGEAQRWADGAVRINAVAPAAAVRSPLDSADCLEGESDLAALGLFLASARGKSLSGHVFDATGVGRQRC